MNQLAIILLLSAIWPCAAQQLGRPQDGFCSGQSNGQVDLRVDGCPKKNEGLPPSAADKAIGSSTIPSIAKTARRSMHSSQMCDPPIKRGYAKLAENEQSVNSKAVRVDQLVGDRTTSARALRMKLEPTPVPVRLSG